MRAIGMAERALIIHKTRLLDQSLKPFGKVLATYGVNSDQICQSRLEIDQARLLVLQAAAEIDKQGAKLAKKYIASIVISY